MGGRAWLNQTPLSPLLIRGGEFGDFMAAKNLNF